MRRVRIWIATDGDAMKVFNKKSEAIDYIKSLEEVGKYQWFLESELVEQV